MPLEESSLSPAALLRQWLEDSRRLHIPLLLGVALLMRMGVFFHLDTVMLGWREADMSSIAANYLRNGFRFLYPQIDWGGGGPGYVEMEFPIIPFLTAVLFKIFGAHDICALIIPFLSGLCVVIAVYFLGRRLIDSSIGFVAAIFVAVSPLLSLASQTFLGEPALLLCSILSVYYLLGWVENGRWSDYLFSMFFTTLAVLLKLTALYIGLPLLAIVANKYGRSLVRRRAFWSFGIFSLLPVFLWYCHAHNIYVEYGNTFGILSGGYNKFARVDLLMSPDFYSLIAKRVLLSVSTPVVFILFLFGLYQRPSRAVVYAMHWWAAALVIYTLLIAEGNKDMIYYQLPWLPVLSIFGTIGMFSFLDVMGKWSFVSSPARRLPALVAVLSIVIISLAGVIVRSSHVPITFLDYEAGVKGLAEEVKEVTPPGSLLVVATSYGNEKTPSTIDTPPQMFYFSGRHGWYLALAWLTPAAVDSLKEEGADFLVVFGGDVKTFHENPSLFEQLTSRFPPVVDRADLLVLGLHGKQRS